MVIPDILTNFLGQVNDLSVAIGTLLNPFINLIFAVSAFVIVVACLYSAVEHLVHIRQERDVLSAMALGTHVIVASVLLSLVATAHTPLNLLYLVATAAIAIGARVGVAKLNR